MEKELLTSYVIHPEGMNKETLVDFSLMLSSFPYFQTGRMLYLKNLWEVEDPTFELELQSSAIRIGNCRNLYCLIHDPDKLFITQSVPIIQPYQPKDYIEIEESIDEIPEIFDLSPKVEASQPLSDSIELSSEKIVATTVQADAQIAVDEIVIAKVEVLEIVASNNISIEVESVSSNVEVKNDVPLVETVSPPQQETIEVEQVAPIEIVVAQEMAAEIETVESTQPGILESARTVEIETVELVSSQPNATVKQEAQSDFLSGAYTFSQWLEIISNPKSEFFKIADEYRATTPPKIEIAPPAVAKMVYQNPTISSTRSPQQEPQTVISELRPVVQQENSAAIETNLIVNSATTNETKPNLTNIDAVSAENRLDNSNNFEADKIATQNEASVPEPAPKQEEFSLEGELITETLARIYIKQKSYAKALKIFEKLCLKYPEKNVYFAAQIKYIEHLIDNQKK